MFPVVGTCEKKQVRKILKHAKGPSVKYVTLGGGRGGGWVDVGLSVTKRYMGVGGGGGYLADRYITPFFICLVFSLSTEGLSKKGGGGGGFPKTNVILCGVYGPALRSVTWGGGGGGSLKHNKKA